AAKQAVEIFLVLAAQCAAEFRPPRDGVVDQLPECRNCAAHKIRDSRPRRVIRDPCDLLSALSVPSVASVFSVLNLEKHSPQRAQRTQRKPQRQEPLSPAERHPNCCSRPLQRRGSSRPATPRSRG